MLEGPMLEGPMLEGPMRVISLLGEGGSLEFLASLKRVSCDGSSYLALQVVSVLRQVPGLVPSRHGLADPESVCRVPHVVGAPRHGNDNCCASGYFFCDTLSIARRGCAGCARLLAQSRICFYDTQVCSTIRSKPSVAVSHRSGFFHRRSYQKNKLSRFTDPEIFRAPRRRRRLPPPTPPRRRRLGRTVPSASRFCNATSKQNPPTIPATLPSSDV